MKNRKKRCVYARLRLMSAFLCLLGVATYALSDGISTASESKGTSLLTAFTAGDGDAKTDQLLSDPITIEPATHFKGNIPFRITFDSNDFVGPMESYSWNFGDGEMAQGAVASHTFISAGTYSVILTVKEQSGHVREELIMVSATSRQ